AACRLRILIFDSRRRHHCRLLKPRDRQGKVWWAMTSTHAPYYQRSGVAIYHGDCRDVLTSFAAETFDGVITDPPYLVNYRGRFDAKCAAIAGDGDASW